MCFQVVHDLTQAAVAVLVPRDVVDNGAVEAIEQDVAGCFVGWFSDGEAAAHDAEMAFDAEFSAGGGDLARGVGLHDAAANDAVRIFRLSSREAEFEFADLVAADTKPGAVVTFDPEG